MIEPPGADELLFLPLGGAGEIGMNLTLYGHAGQWLMVDLGVTFGDDATPGIEVIMPDPSFIEDNRDRLSGLVLTHAHEDHIGAVPYLWPDLGCPIYATPFTASVLRRKLVESGIEEEAEIVEVPLSGRFKVGPFDLEFITLTHSIPEPNAVAIRTPCGTVLHTGDWKLDPDPLVGEVTDEAALKKLGAEGVLAMVCDSTNALVPGHSGSESLVRANLTEMMGRFQGRIAVACFASNVARLESVARAAAHHDRHAALVGRSLWRINKAARETGYLADLPEFVSEHDAGFLPRDKVVLLCTGSQGEPRSALARIARGEHPAVMLEAGDAVLFSSRVIPGNDRAIGRLQNDLAKLGVEIVTERDNAIHVSGHPARDELIAMYQWVRPQIAVPVHGEYRHLAAHARLAEDCQVPQSVLSTNGDVIRLAPGPARKIGEVPSGRLGLDGKVLMSLDGEAMRLRHRMLHNGTAVATLVLDETGLLAAEPQIAIQGLLEPDEMGEAREDAADAVRTALVKLRPADRKSDATVKEAARLAIRKTLQNLHGKKPLTEVHLVRL
ncbi:MAG TPA: ribonuclease J [Hypericibacter adhaerens]|uniref:MBL fold hydrolase n=1 Tax=Hypericibacter adhaerens TaxID=2602016 RepID=A0A5J6MZS9_9PROT|nr:ribonuclease J [Hypericibacter adhaerens]QEX22353.1 MBL fold hydrolase [Hypericibacter adhaerens]HWA46007.1 ribonuclease J [Hypericibacter adhaerens]